MIGYLHRELTGAGNIDLGKIVFGHLGLAGGHFSDFFSPNHTPFIHSAAGSGCFLASRRSVL